MDDDDASNGLVHALCEHFPFLREYPSMDSNEVFLAGESGGLHCHLSIIGGAGCSLRVPSTLDPSRLVAHVPNNGRPDQAAQVAGHLAPLLPTGRVAQVIAQIVACLSDQQIIYTIGTHSVRGMSSGKREIPMPFSWSVCFLHASVEFLITVTAPQLAGGGADDARDPMLTLTHAGIELIPRTSELGILMQRLAALMRSFVASDDDAHMEDSDGDGDPMHMDM